MESIGQYLKCERELRGISLEELAKTTRIPAKNVALLEADRFSDLPGEVFTKGFIRAYAKAVGLSPESTLSRFDSSQAPAPESIPSPLALAGEPERGKRFGMAIAVVVLLILFTLALSIVLQPRQRNTPAELSQAPASQSLLGAGQGA